MVADWEPEGGSRLKAVRTLTCKSEEGPGVPAAGGPRNKGTAARLLEGSCADFVLHNTGLPLIIVY